MLPWMLDSQQRGEPYPNVWIGATVVNQEEADRDIPKLLSVPAAKRFLSMEPLLGPVDLTNYLAANALHEIDGGPRLDWVIVGGESGPKARPMHPDWARSLRNQCQAAGVPFLFKQWGEFAPNWFNDDANQKIPGSEWIERMGKKVAGRLLDGREWNGFPS
jgi:protein gp37